MAISYVEVNSSNELTWKAQLYSFASTLDVAQRCNAAAVAANKLQLTYPSPAAIQEFIDRDCLIVVAQENGVIFGYMICVDDRGLYGKHGGCQCRWIGIGGVPPPAIPGIYAAMGDIAVSRYGWLWGRVTNATIRNLMVTIISGCALGIPDEPEIVTYKKP